MFKKAIPRIGLAISAALAAYAAQAQRGEEDDLVDRTPEDCILVRRIDETTVLDNETILFYMRGGDIYRNILDSTCPGLGRSKRFAYRTSTGRLCDIDTVTVFDPYDRFPGSTCRLGEFHPITAAEAELLELGPDAEVAASRSVQVTPVELPDEDTTEPAESAAQDEAAPAEQGQAAPAEPD